MQISNSQECQLEEGERSVLVVSPLLSITNRQSENPEKMGNTGS